MRINNLAQLKRLEVGREIKLIEVEGMKNHKALNQIRKIEVKQTNSIKFEGGSWLYFPKSFEFESWDNGFIIWSSKNTPYEIKLKYEVLDNGC